MAREDVVRWVLDRNGSASIPVYLDVIAEFLVGRANLPADVDAFLAEVEARANRATPGPWKVLLDDADQDDPPDTIYAVRAFGPWSYVEHEHDGFFASVGDVDRRDAEFIAHARADVPTLCAIIRKQAAELARWQRASGCANPETISAVIADFYRRAECRPPLDGIPDGIDRIKKERAELRERLAKLELLTRDALNILGPEYFDDGKPFEELGHLVNIKGGA